MEQIDLGTTGRRTSRLGYGCTGLMGATGRKRSLALLEQVFDAGIRHFDVAPLYGFRAAEGCLGEFLARHRDEVTVATKYGIPGASRQGLLGVARRVAGPVVKLLPGIKRRLARAANTVAAPAERRASFTASEAKTSMDHSLSELRTDRIDLWLLHEVEAADLVDDTLLRFLEDSVAGGAIGSFGAGSSADKISAPNAERPRYCPVLQFEWSIFDQPIRLTHQPDFTLHHRALTANFHTLHAALLRDPDRCRRWSVQVDADLAQPEILSALMLKAAVVLNPSSIILFSSRNPAHIVRNVAVAGDASLNEPAKRLYAITQAEGAPRSSGDV